MLKAAALYIVIIIAIVIAIFSGSLITTAFFYKLEYQKSLRFSRLASNIESGKAILLSENSSNGETLMDLYGEGTDSISLTAESWGAFDMALIKSFSVKDTLKKAFLIANSTTKDPSALYLSDEDRPLSVSGSTLIKGNAFLPKAGSAPRI